MSTEQENADAAPSTGLESPAPEPKPETPASTPPAESSTPTQTSEAAPAAAAAPLDASSEAASDAGDGDAEDGEEGDEAGGEEAGGGEGAAADGAAADGAAPGDGVKKKRRRRRRKKKDGAVAGVEGAPPAEGENAEGAPAEGTGDESGGPKREPRERRRPDPREALPFRIGEEVFGKVDRVTEDSIWVDVAGKAFGLFDRRELGDGEPPQVGDQFIATVASHGVRGGMLRMSRSAFSLDDAKVKVEAAKNANETLEGFVTGAIRGGVEVDFEGLRAFAPASHVELRPNADLSALVGRRLQFEIVQYEKKGRDVVVSRRKFLAEEAANARVEAMRVLSPGSTHQGIVRSVMQWGVFVALPDAGNIEGLVHASEAAHDRAAKLNELYKPGDPVEVKVLRIDENGKLWLSRKAMMSDPWGEMLQKYAVGSRHTGKVVRLQPFGAFVELEPGIDGLCYTQDLSIKPIQHPQDMLKVDDTIDVIVAQSDGTTRRISLHPAPPEEEANEPRPRVGPNRSVNVSVVQPQEHGLLVRVIGLTGRAARGFIPAGHTGTQRGTDLRKFFPIGTRIEAKVIEVDTRRGETKLSIRALKEDTEKAAYQEYRDQVSREAKFGTLGDLLKK